MKTNELTLTRDDDRLAHGVASLTEQGVTFEYDALTGKVHISGVEGRSKLMEALTEKLAESLVTSHRIGEELRRCLNRN